MNLKIAWKNENVQFPLTFFISQAILVWNRLVIIFTILLQ